MRYIPIDNSIQQHGRAWRYMVGAVCISVYRQHGGRVARYAVGAGQHGRKEGDILVYDMRTQYTTIQPPSPEPRNARVRVSRACVRVRALYYYIIIIL